MFVLIDHKCFDCRQEEIKKLQGKKLIRCIDCGKEILVDAKSRSKRCDECKKNAEKEKYKKYNSKRK